ncbi:FkbM family methyltransferase [Pseudomonas guariconensis]|uniref:FkbM family methyltransferase n=1 Tax=Pseudomonas guariconensis TaxID=1288410 RepID=UPI00300CF471
MTFDHLNDRLERLLSEPVEAIRRRQFETLDQLLGGLDKPFILFGAGNLGKKALKVLQGMGLHPLAFIDNNPKLWGSEILGLQVYGPAQYVEQHPGELPGLIATIWCGEATDRMQDRLGPLQALGFERIALFGHLAWRYPQSFLPHYSLDLPEKVVAKADEIRQAYALLGDEASRRLFVDHVQWRLFLDYDLLPPASPRAIYFDAAFCNERADEVVYDIGAFNGDSVEGYLNSGRPFSQIHSFEPSSANYAALCATLARLDGRERFYAHAMAVGDSRGEIFIEASGGPAARVGSGSERVEVTTLDDLAKAIAEPTFIKIDIEGFEPQCLAGGQRLISERHPVIAVCVYHEQEHLWSILLQLHGYYPGYHFSLGPHLAEGWDLVLYAVPADRLPSQYSAE